MTQHPDSATRYVPIQDEPAEAVEALTPLPAGLGMDEVMIDFEGKLTPYHQTAQVVNGLFEAGLVPGRDVSVTPRIASASKETTFKQLMAILSVVETNYLSLEMTSAPVVTEVILPMVESAEEVLQARRRIEHVMRLAHDEFGVDNDKNAITVIPIFEEVPQLIGVGDLLRKYVSLCKDEGFEVSGLRYMLARSDPALSYGMVPAVLAGKLAISAGYELEKECGVAVAPILGAGSLPFRGHVTPSNVENILKEYGGVRTVTIQSGLRYDHPKDKTAGMVRLLMERLPLTCARVYAPWERDLITNMIGIFTRTYIEAFSRVIGTVSKISDLIPKQRDRLARKSKVGYARDVARPEKLAVHVTDTAVGDALLRLNLEGIVELPRAISFSAALYTIGYPPEFLGIGRGLREVVARYGQGGLSDLLAYYPSLAGDLRSAGRYLHLGNAGRFFPDACSSLLKEDVDEAMGILGLELPAGTEGDELHRTLMEMQCPMIKQFIGDGRDLIFKRDREAKLMNECILRMGAIRGSLG